MWFLRLLVFALLAFIIWRVVRLSLRILGGGPRHSEPHRMTDHPEMPDLKNIEDADFEDLTPPPGKTPPPGDS